MRQTSTLARIRIRNKGRADHAHWRLVRDIDEPLVRRWRWRWLGAHARTVGEPDLFGIAKSQQADAARNGHADAGDRCEQNHVAVFFANSHAKKTGQRRDGSSRQSRLPGVMAAA